MVVSRVKTKPLEAAAALVIEPIAIAAIIMAASLLDFFLPSTIQMIRPAAETAIMTTFKIMSSPVFGLIFIGAVFSSPFSI